MLRASICFFAFVVSHAILRQERKLGDNRFVTVQSSLLQFRDMAKDLAGIDILYSGNKDDGKTNLRIDFEPRMTPSGSKWCVIVTADAKEHATAGDTTPWRRRMYVMKATGTPAVTGHGLQALVVESEDGSIKLTAPVDFGAEVATDDAVGKVQYKLEVKATGATDYMQEGTHVFFLANPIAGSYTKAQVEQWFKDKAAHEIRHWQHYKEMKENHAKEEYEAKWGKLEEQDKINQMINDNFPDFLFGDENHPADVHAKPGAGGTGTITLKFAKSHCPAIPKSKIFTFPSDAAGDDVQVSYTKTVVYTVRQGLASRDVAGNRWVCKWSADFISNTGQPIAGKKPQFDRQTIRDDLKKLGVERAKVIAEQEMERKKVADREKKRNEMIAQAEALAQQQAESDEKSDCGPVKCGAQFQDQ